MIDISAELLILSDELRRARPGMRLKAMRSVARRLNRLAAEIIAEDAKQTDYMKDAIANLKPFTGTVDAVMNLDGSFTLADAIEVNKSISNDDPFPMEMSMECQATFEKDPAFDAMMTLISEGVVHGFRFGTKPLFPALQRELNPCSKCGEIIRTAPFDDVLRQNGAKALCTHCIEERFPGIQFLWSKHER